MILICPAVDILIRDFPEAQISLLVGVKGKSLFTGNPHYKKIYFYDKKMSFPEKLKWFQDLRRERYDLVVDFRNSALPYFLNTRFRTPPEVFYRKDVHLKIKHFLRLKSVYDYKEVSSAREALYISSEDKKHIQNIMRRHLKEGDPFVVVAPLAADSNKTWLPEYFAMASDDLIRRFGVKIFMTGGPQDMAVIEKIGRMAKEPIINLAGQTTLVQLGELIRHARLTIAHDSGIMHIASYFDCPVLALFGPTQPLNSHPWSAQSAYIRRNHGCEVCARPSLKKFHTCMNNIKPQEVLEAAQFFLKS